MPFFSRDLPMLALCRLPNSISRSVYCSLRRNFFYFIPTISYLFLIHFIYISYFFAAGRFKPPCARIIPPQSFNNAVFSRLRKHRYGIRMAKANKSSCTTVLITTEKIRCGTSDECRRSRIRRRLFSFHRDPGLEVVVLILRPLFKFAGVAV